MTAACFGDAIHAQVVMLPRRIRSDIYTVAGVFGYAYLDRADSCHRASLHKLQPVVQISWT